MIFIDNQGSFTPQDVWYPFRETEWNGLAPADTIFPTFLFLVGFSVVLALQRHQRTATRHIFKKIAFRALKLFLMGVLLNLWASGFHLEHFVIMGVLQRIGICYFIESITFVSKSEWLSRAIAVVCAIVYCIVMYCIPFNGCGRANLTAMCNAGGFIDRAIFGVGHVPSSGTIPEGLLSTCTAVLTTHIGLEFGLLFSQFKGQCGRLTGYWTLVSAALIGLGSLLALVVPLNKKLWSPSFTLVVSGISGCVLVLWLVTLDLPNTLVAQHQRKVGTPSVNSTAFHNGAANDVQTSRLLPVTQPHPTPSWAPLLQRLRNGVAWLCRPLMWLGRNPALTFVAMVALEVLLMDSLRVSERTSVWAYVYQSGYLAAIGTAHAQLASSLVAATHLLVWIVVCGILHRYSVYITF